MSSSATAHPRSRVPLAGVLLLAVLTVLVVPVAVLAGAGPAQAAVAHPFTRAFAANAQGTVAIIGNTLMTCATGSARSTGATCAQARAGTANSGGANDNNNNGYTSEHVDVDGDAYGVVTANSSSAVLTVPARGDVLYAALAWGAQSTSSSRGTALLHVPGATSYATVTDSAPQAIGRTYQGWADVTELVAAAGSGTYTVGGVRATTGVDEHAGWSLVVVLTDPAAPARNLTVYHGFGGVDATNGADMTVSGFLTPPTGTVRTEIGIVGYDGDRQATGDQLLVNSPVLGTAFRNVSDALNPAGNIFNSSISTRGTDTGERTPAYRNQLGHDIDTITATDLLGNDETSAVIRLTTDSEKYFPGVVTFATDLYEPHLAGTKTVTDLDGGAVEPGDVLRYIVPVSNTGLDSAADSRITDAVPTGTTYLPGTLRVGSGDGTTFTFTPVSDAAGDDAGEFVAGEHGGVVQVRIGSGADATAGGTLQPVDLVTEGPTHYAARFDVTVDADVPDGATLVNVGQFLSRGATSGEAASAFSTTVTSTVQGTPPGGSGAPGTEPDLVSIKPTLLAPTVTVDVLANDAAGLSVVAVTDAAGGTVTLHADGTIDYRPHPTFAGRDVFTYTVTSAAGAQATEVVVVEVVNELPVAVADTAATHRNGSVTVTPTSNDADPNDDQLALLSVGTPGHGTVTVTGGQVLYRPTTGYVGTDTLSYLVQDARGGRATGTVTFTITNRAPTGTADVLATQADTAHTFTSVLDDDTDPDGDALTAVLVTGPSHGTVHLATDGTGTYTPAAGFHGVDSFTYRPHDGLVGGAVVTVTITVNGAPVAVDDVRSTGTDTPLTFDPVANDTDPDGTVPTLTSVDQPTSGSTVLHQDGTVTYTPAPGVAGTATFDYDISDGAGGTATGTVTVTVLNAVPVAEPDFRGALVGTVVTYDVRVNDTDANVRTPAVTSQTLTVAPGSLTVSAGATVALDGQGRVVVTPVGTTTGDVVVQYTIGDGAGGTASSTLTVHYSYAPVAVDDAPPATPTDTPLTIDVLGNDSDPDGDPLTVVAASLGDPVDAEGTVRGTVTVVDGAVLFTPTAGWSGTATFTYRVTDGTYVSEPATVTVHVANAAPEVEQHEVSADHGADIEIDVLVGATDPNLESTGQELTVVGLTADQGATVTLTEDGRVRVVPPAGFKGVVTITYTVSDGAGGQTTGEVLVTVQNAVPVAVDDHATSGHRQTVLIAVLNNDLDHNYVDTVTLIPGSVTQPVEVLGAVAPARTASAERGVAGGVLATQLTGAPRGTATAAGDGIRYTPEPGFSGTVRFRYTVTDGESEASAIVTVTLLAAEDSAAEQALTTPGTAVTIAAVDALGERFDSITSISTPVAGGTVRLVDGHLEYTPAPGFLGTDTFTYTAVDADGHLVTTTVSVTVAASPDEPGSGAPDGDEGPGTTDGDEGAGAPPAAPMLPRTGIDGVPLVAAAVAVLGTGGLMLLGARRRR